MICYHRYASPLGAVTEASDGETLVGLWFDGQKNFPDVSHGEAPTDGASRVFSQTDRWLDTYFRGEVPDFTPPITVSGSPFQRAVYEILLTVPYGETCTYGDIAKKIAESRGVKKISAQAVGGAVGKNPISLIVPCHRVVGADGSLTGYAGGPERKIRLLALEGIHLPIVDAFSDLL